MRWPLWTALSLFLSMLISPVQAGEFWQSGWQEPGALETELIHIEPLQNDQHSAFFQAYENYADQLRSELGWGWPALIPTADQNQELVGYHVRQHEAHEAFTYTLQMYDRRGAKRLVGAVYLVPVLAERDLVPGLNSADYDVELSWWVNPPGRDYRGHEELLPLLLRWIATEGPWDEVLLPVSNTYQAAQQAIEEQGFRRIAGDEDDGVSFYRVNISR